MISEQYRHEYKYPLSVGDRLIAESRIRTLAKKDSHIGKKGFYQIRSLYFDDYEDNCYRENINGTDDREKFRIRIYNHSTDSIKLEIKSKYRGMTQKKSCLISLEQCQALMKGEVPEIVLKEQQVLQKLCVLMQTRLMRPVVIVEYERVPYVYRKEDANVRVTFDSNIKSGSKISTFLDEKIPGRSILMPGKELMEVKFDEFLPDEVRSVLQLGNFGQKSFSKYALCRKYSG